MKKKLICVLVFCMLAASACTSEKEQKPEERVTDYYEAGEIKLPEELSDILTVTELEDGSLEMAASTRKESGLLFGYDREKGEWEKTGNLTDKLGEASMVAKADYVGEGQYFVMYYGDASDSIRYALVSKGGTLSPFSPEVPEELSREGGLLLFQENSKYGGIFTANNGMGKFYLSDLGTGRILQDYSRQGLRYGETAFVWKDNLIVVGEEVECVQIETGEKVDLDEYLKQFLEGQEHSIFCVDHSNEAIYRMSTDGIGRYLPEEGKSEELLKDRLRMFAGEEVMRAGAMLCGNKDIITWRLESENTWSMTEFAYTDIGKEKDTRVMSVYLLHEDMVLDSLFAEFEEAHPGIHIEVRYGIGEKDTSLVVEDAIKLLNTEIASGNGPDLMLADQLPVDSYMESNLLADLRGIVEKKLDSGKYFNNILTACETDGKICAVPLSFELVAVQGEERILEASADFEKTAQELKRVKEKNPGQMVLSKVWYGGTLKVFYNTYFKTCFDESGSLVPERVKAFFESAKAIWELSTCDAREKEEADLQYSPDVDEGMSTQQMYQVLSEVRAAFGSVDKSETLQIMQGLKKEKKMDWELIKAGGTADFIPKMQFCVLESSKHKEEALEFIEYALGDGQKALQSWSLGLAVEKDLFTEGLETKLSGMEIGFDEKEMKKVPYSTFSEKEIKKLCGEIEKCRPQDVTIRKMSAFVLEPCIAYINGEILLEDAVNTTVSKVNLMKEE